jgi:hypothetical protein
LPGIVRRPVDDGVLVALFSIGGALLGGLVGLIVGVLVYPPTAPFAVVEVGLPGAIAGVVIGAMAVAVRALRAGWRARRPSG